MKPSVREPIPELFTAAKLLDAAVCAHQSKRHDLAEFLLKSADMDTLREWTESHWGKNTPQLMGSEHINLAQV